MAKIFFCPAIISVFSLRQNMVRQFRHFPPLRHQVLRLLCTSLLLLGVGQAHAINECELNGERVDPANGNTTRDKSGIMHCRDRESGQLTHERELRAGRFIGLDRFYRNGKLVRERSVNEQGNTQGIMREYGPEGHIVREASYDNGGEAGLSRRNYPDGSLLRATYYAPQTRQELAYAEFTAQGHLHALKCGEKPMLAPLADDARLCGFSGKLTTTELFNDKGYLQRREHYLAGQLQLRETLYENGNIERTEEWGAGTREERYFTLSGLPQSETWWVLKKGTAHRALEREYSTQGTLIREQRWEEGYPLRDERFYLNGQPQLRLDYRRDADNQLQIEEVRFHDNGHPARKGTYMPNGRYDRFPVGLHQLFDERGQLTAESSYDTQGHITREKVWSAQGLLIQDELVYADGSRKAYHK